MTSIRTLRKLKLHYLLMALGLCLLTYSVWRAEQYILDNAKKADAESFAKATAILKDKVESYIHGLQGMGGFVIAKDNDPSIKDVRDYAEFRHFFSNFPGALGFGFIRYVEEKNIQKYLSKLRKQKRDFHIISLSEYRGPHFIVEMIEPIESNRQALGLDIASESRRRDTAQEAIDTALPSLTPPIELVQAMKAGTGFHFYLPIYSQIRVPKDIKSRRKSFIGWAYAPILAPALIEHLKKNVHSDLFYKIVDVSNSGSELLIHSGGGDSKIFDKQGLYEGKIEVGGRTWKILATKKDNSYDNFILYISILAWLLGLASISVFGRFVGSVFQFKETSNRKLESIESWQAAVLGATNLSIIATDVDGLITFFNKGAEQMLDYKASDLLYKENPSKIHVFEEIVQRNFDLEKEFSVRMDPGFKTFVYKTDMTNKPDSNEWTYVKRSGDRLRVRLTINSINNKKGETLGYLGIAEDITKIKLLEKTIESQRINMLASAKMSSLGEMAGGIAHEINNPLAIISSRVSILQMKLKLGMPDLEDLKAELEKINQTTIRIASIIKGLRSFSRDGTKDPMVEVEMETILNDTMDLCRERFLKNGVQLSVAGDFKHKIKCRPVQISQVLMNLITNAYDASMDNEDKWVRIECIRVANAIKVSIFDSGFGIDPDIVVNMMNPFFTSKVAGKGTGLGLSISKSIVEDHEGSLYYDRTQSNTCFVMEFKLC